MDYSEIKYFETVVLAALLHDVGKFMQRANKYQCSKNNDKAEKNKCGLSEACDGKKKGTDYKHSCHSYWFIKEIGDIFPENQRDTILRIAFRHHEKTNDPLEAIIRMSDHFSAGCDRTKKQIECSHYYKRQPMRSIFDKISFTKTSQHETYYQIAQLEAKNTLPSEPPKEKQDKELYIPEWEKRWDTLALQFESDLKKVKNLKFDRLILALNTILEQYTWCIPSSTWVDEPDISLYDHLLTSAVFAAAMFRYYEDKYGTDTDKWDIEVINSWKEQAFYFVTGDLSGIQDYLFDLRRGKYSAKLLRARSFELQMLSEASIRHILKKCGLPPICRVMNAAGRFILALPNTSDVRNKLDNAREEIETFCKGRYLGKLNVNISRGFPASGDFLRQERALDLFFPQIAADVDDAKQCRFQAILDTTADFFINNGYEGFHSNQDLCPSCGKRPVSAVPQYEIEDEPLCTICSDLVKLGGSLTSSPYMAWVEDREKATLKLFDLNHIKLLNEVKRDDLDSFAMRKYEPGLPLLSGAFHVPTIKEMIEMHHGGQRSIERTKTFEELAEEAEGDKNIAMFKADVDNLGSLFSIGMGQNVSISRFATLSRMVNYFFTSYVDDLIKRDPVYARSMYTVFSGGDDLCVIGPWDKVVAFAETFHEHFIGFVSKNNITASGGIAVSTSKVPSNSIFLAAEEALHLSKSVTAEKNRITLFNTTVPWNRFGELMRVARMLEPYIKSERNLDSDNKNKHGKAIFYRLLLYGEKAKALDPSNRVINPRDALWISHFYYDVSRNIKEEQRDRFMALCMENMKEIRLPVSYVLYKNRKGGNSDG